MDITYVRDAIYGAFNWAAQEASNAGQTIITLSNSAYEAVAPHLQPVLAKIREIDFFTILKSNPSIAIGLTLVCITCAVASRQVECIFGKATLLAASIAAAIFAGMFLFNPALLPAGIRPIAGVV